MFCGCHVVSHDARCYACWLAVHLRCCAGCMLGSSLAQSHKVRHQAAACCDPVCCWSDCSENLPYMQHRHSYVTGKDMVNGKHAGEDNHICKCHLCSARAKGRVQVRVDLGWLWGGACPGWPQLFTEWCWAPAPCLQRYPSHHMVRPVSHQYCTCISSSTSWEHICTQRRIIVYLDCVLYKGLNHMQPA